jgi:prepilin-type processing-associated H-X9-DG protein
MWYERLLPFNNKTGATLICPAAEDPGNAIGSAFQAWGPNRTYSAGSPNWVVRGTFAGSYGFNGWLYEFDYQAIPREWRERVVRLPAQRSDRIPVLGDCSEERGMPRDIDTPGDLIHPRPFVPPGGRPPPEQPGGHWGDLRLFCLDRHERAVNLVFLDGHAERVPLAQLWKLKWNNSFVPRDVVIP